VRARLLGSGAGGGVPQWNCGCARCAAARTGAARARTQSSLAVAGEDGPWFLLNVSPDVRQQLAASPELWPPPGAPRGSVIGGCVLTDAELDHVTGLTLLREGERFGVRTTVTVRRWLSERFPLEAVLARYCERPFEDFALDEPFELRGGHGATGLSVRAFELGRRAPRWVGADEGEHPGAVVGLVVEDARGGRLVYAPAVAGPSAALERALAGADAALLDGTFWDEGELARHRPGAPSARAIGHWPVGGADGSLAWLSRLAIRERVYVHVNNTNPMLDERSPERREVERAGIRVGWDGWTFET